MLSTTKLKANYKIGDEVRARVIERIDDTDWIVSCDGMLVRVTNKAQVQLKVDQFIILKIKSLEPVLLRIL